MRRGRELLAGAALIGVAIVFALAMLEIGVRWLHLVPDRFWETDPVLGKRLIAGRRGWWTQEDREFLVPIEINRRGLRDVAREDVKAPGVFRILVLGDSFVEAMHVPLADTFTRVLEQQLNRPRTTSQVEVVSAGVSGYGTASELLYYQREGVRYEPDLVLLAFYPGNDVKNNSPTLEDTLKPVYGVDGTIQRVVGEGPQKRPGGWRGWIARLATYHYFRQLLLQRYPQLAQGLVLHGLLRAAAIRTLPQQDGVPVDYGVYAGTLRPEWQQAWEMTYRLLEQLQRAASASQARLAIAILPSRHQICPDRWQEVLTAHPRMQGQQWDLDAPQHHVEDWCAAHAVPCVALAPAFRAAAARGTAALYLQHDGHWTIAAHRLAATTLRDFIEQHHLVPRQQESSNDGL